MAVDDEFVSRKKITQIMGKIGRCDAFENGEQAVEAFKEAWEELDPYDLACLDLYMPGMDGREVLKEIKRLEDEMELGPESRLKSIMITAYSDQEDVLTSLESGCDAYVVKPFEGGRLLKKIYEILDISHHFERAVENLDPE